MIPWFFNQQRIRAFPGLSTRKKSKMKLEVDQRYAEQRRILSSRLESARNKAKSADRFLKREMDEKAKEAINDFKLELVSSQPVLNAYVSTSLEKQLLEMMSIEGFEFPDMLTDLREDIDFGLFSVNLSDHLGIILEAEVDPFEELGIEI